jgi:hypothetical protein
MPTEIEKENYVIQMSSLLIKEQLESNIDFLIFRFCFQTISKRNLTKIK